MAYYLEGIDWTSRQAIGTTAALLELFETDAQRVRTSLTRKAFDVFKYVEQKVVVSIRRTATATGLSVPTVTTALKGLEDLGIVREITGKRHGRLFAYDEQLKILNSTDEPRAEPQPTREEIWIRGFDTPPAG
jgi:Fic family protein